eukprot:g1252.t1
MSGNDIVPGFDSKIFFTDDLDWIKIVYVFIGGLCVGTGDFGGIIIMEFVPASIGFPIYCGVCMILGTILTQMIEPVSSPLYLYMGLLPAVGAMIVLSWASTKKKADPHVVATASSSSSSPKCAESASFVTCSSAHDGAKNVEEGHVANGKGEEQEKPVALHDSKMIMYIGILASLGVLNSAWTAMSTLAGDSINGSMKVFVLALGRFLVQIPLQYTAAKLRNESVVEQWKSAWKMPRCDLVRACGCGTLVGVGYWSFFISVESGTDQASAFAISNCSPLMSVFIGVFFLGELESYETSGRVGVAITCALFSSAISLISMSSS